MLRTKLFLSFAALILLFGLLAGWFGVSLIRTRVVNEAQNRVKLDVGGAWSLYNAKLHEIEVVVSMASGKRTLQEASRSGTWSDLEEVGSRLEVVRTSFGLDFLTLVASDSRVLLRTAPPYEKGDSRLADPLVARALQGETVSATVLMPSTDLAKESEDLVERAFLALEETPRARPTSRTEETRGMVMMSAVPVWNGPQVAGVLYGGVILNRNFDLVDAMERTIYGGEAYKGTPMGTATIFLHDSRITTTVRLANGNRALGTRASKEVADRVLDNGQSWIGRAFVVHDWYLTAYDPIRDPQGQVIGMLYVGILERPFTDLGRSVILRFVGLTAAGVLVSLIVAFFLAGRLARPIHRLVEASRRLEQGEYPPPVPEEDSSTETGNLVHAFNRMVASLQERERSLQQANQSLSDLNHNYMETLGFVTHELNTPVASMMNYAFMLKGGVLGPLTEKQQKAVRVIDDNLRRLAEMVRHYLNLSRIERNEMRISRARIHAAREILRPIQEALEPLLHSRHMQVQIRVPEEIELHADMNMTREVFENLFTNAVKYGRDGGTITWTAERQDGFVRFSVRNEGEGIPPDKLPDLFHKFVRLEGQKTAIKQKGTGLGLFITRHIVEAHGGSIEAQSKPGEWAEFKFTLPAAPIAET